MGETVQRLIDQQALKDLVHTYCRACDRRDFAPVRPLYYDDAIDDHGAMFCGTADEFIAWLPAVMANFEATVHSITNALFIVRGDSAQVELYTHAYHRTSAPDAREILIGGRYLDHYERRAAAWKFLHRALALDWCRVQPVDPSAYREFVAGAPLGKPDVTDPSYLALPFFSRSASPS